MARGRATCLIPASDFDAVIFDLDGVITDKASLHAEAWKRMFDDSLSRHTALGGGWEGALYPLSLVGREQ